MSRQDFTADVPAPFVPTSRGKARVGDRRAPSGVIFVNRNGLR